MKRKTITKGALAISILAIVLCTLFGTASSLAWFADEAVLINKFNFGSLSIELTHKVDGGYEPVDMTTKIFDEDMLYEPGAVQLAYLRLENTGSMACNISFSVMTSNDIDGTNVNGETLHLQDYLKFGIASGETEEEAAELTKNREAIWALADTSLGDFSQEIEQLDCGQCRYIIIAVYMPKQTDNQANYRGDVVPSTELSIEVTARQIKMPTG